MKNTDSNREYRYEGVFQRLNAEIGLSSIVMIVLGFALGIVAFTPAYGGEEMKMWKDLLLLGAKFFLIVGGIFTWYHRSNDI